MLNLADQAKEIVDKLSSIGLFAQVDYLDTDEDAARKPAQFPCAQVFMGQMEAGKPDMNFIHATTSWVVMIRAKKMGGKDGFLPMIDEVLNSLGGYWMKAATKQLVPIGCKYLESTGESAAYAVTFAVHQRGELLFPHKQ